MLAASDLMAVITCPMSMWTASFGREVTWKEEEYKFLSEGLDIPLVLKYSMSLENGAGDWNLQVHHRLLPERKTCWWFRLLNLGSPGVWALSSLSPFISDYKQKASPLHMREFFSLGSQFFPSQLLWQPREGQLENVVYLGINCQILGF